MLYGAEAITEVVDASPTKVLNPGAPVPHEAPASMIFTALVDELKPQVQRAAEAGGALTLHKRVRSINAGYEQAQLAAAANRAAVTAFQGLPVKHAMSPGAVTDAAVGAAGSRKAARSST